MGISNHSKQGDAEGASFDIDKCVTLVRSAAERLTTVIAKESAELASSQASAGITGARQNSGDHDDAKLAEGIEILRQASAAIESFAALNR